MVDVVADVAAFEQGHSHLVVGLQLYGRNDGVAVFRVQTILFIESGHHVVVDLQTSTGSQVGFIAVNGDSEAVDARAGNSEDAGLHIVAISQVKEDVFVGDDNVVTKGSDAGQRILIV